MTYTCQDAEAFLQTIPLFAQRLNFQILRMDGQKLTVRIPQNPELGRKIGIFGGQAIMAAADSLGPICIASALGVYKEMTTVDFICHFLRPLPVKDIEVELNLIKTGRQLSLVRADFCARGETRLGATATVTYAFIDKHS